MCINACNFSILNILMSSKIDLHIYSVNHKINLSITKVNTNIKIN